MKQTNFLTSEEVDELVKIINSLEDIEEIREKNREIERRYFLKRIKRINNYLIKIKL